MRLPEISPENHSEIYRYYGREGVTWAPVARGLSRSAALLLNPTIAFMPDAREEVNKLHQDGAAAIVASNHQSAYDPFVATAAIHGGTAPAFKNPAAVAKASLHSGALIGPLFRRSGTIPVFRPQDVPNLSEEDFRAMSDEMLETFAKLIERGRPVGIMPEGTRHPEGFQRENLKNGIARVALATSGQSYIVPMAIVYRDNVPRGVGDIADARRARVVIGNPISGYNPDKDSSEEVLDSVFAGVSGAISYGQTGRA